MGRRGGRLQGLVGRGVRRPERRGHSSSRNEAFHGYFRRARAARPCCRGHPDRAPGAHWTARTGTGTRRKAASRRSAIIGFRCAVPPGGLYARDYREACLLAWETSDPPKKVSKQLFMIAPKIREVDETLRNAPSLADRVFEVHPEVAFWRLNGGRALPEPKKVKGRPFGPGLALRRTLLADHGFSKATTEQAAPPGAAIDDLLDSLACAAIARRILARVAVPFPDPPLRDEFGLPVAIWA